MSKMGDFVIEVGEIYEKRHPDKSWEEIMDIICFRDIPEVKIIEEEVYKRRGITIEE